MGSCLAAIRRRRGVDSSDIHELLDPKAQSPGGPMKTGQNMLSSGNLPGGEAQIMHTWVIMVSKHL